VILKEEEIQNTEELKKYFDLIFLPKNIINQDSYEVEISLELEKQMDSSSSFSVLDEFVMKDKVFTSKCNETKKGFSEIIYKFFPVFYVLTVLFCCYLYKKYRMIKDKFEGLKISLEQKMKNRVSPTSTQNSNFNEMSEIRDLRDLDVSDIMYNGTSTFRTKKSKNQYIGQIKNF